MQATPTTIDALTCLASAGAMGVDAWITIGVIVLVLLLLVFTRYAADVLLTAGLTLLLVAPVPDGGGWRIGVIGVTDAISGLSNPGLVTVAVLYIVVTGLRETGGVQWITRSLLGRPKSLPVAQARTVVPVAVLSAFLNNTPVVAMMIPALNDWSRKLRISASKLMMPLSFAAILGGACTLIGTSTNLVVNGLIIEQLGPERALGIFDITRVGLPVAIAGLAYILLFSRFVLPERRPPAEVLADARRYTSELMVPKDSPLAGQTIEQAGLRHLPGAYLVEIERAGDRILAVGPDQTLQSGDRLVFVGVVESVKELHQTRGLAPATDQVFKLDSPRFRRTLTEAVVSPACPLVGKTIRAGRFRTVYGAAIVAAHRNGEQLTGKVGDIVLRAGDTLLLEADPSFVERMRDRRDFLLISQLHDSAPPRHDRASLAVLILLLMVLSVTAGWLDMLTAALVAGGLMIVARCCTATAARRSIDWSVLVVIGAAFGLGHAMQLSGAADGIAHALLDLAGGSPWWTLVAVYVLTVIFTELITNNAAAVLMFPVAVSAAADLDVNPMPFAIAIMIAASASFLTPIGYQTNLMVFGPGGYRFGDYARLGLPLVFIVAAITLLLVPIAWPF